MGRPSFLSLFLTCLAIAVALAAYVRIRAYREEPLPQASAETGFSRSTSEPVPATGTLPIRSETAPVQESSRLTREQLREQILREAQAQGQSHAQQPSAPQPERSPQFVPATSTTPRPVKPLPIAAPASSPPPAVSTHARATTTTEAPKDPKDPNSDTMPPQLLSIEFDPLQVHDGDEARVIMMATDDLSGIKGISGTVTSPTGKALQGFAGVREGDTNRFHGRFVVPKNGEEGLWHVNVLTMTDNATNTVTLSTARGTLNTSAALRVVSSESDSTPPVLKSARAEQRAMNAGDVNPIYIEAEDDRSGVNLVSAVFQSPNKRARVGAACHAADTNLWVCEMSLRSCIDCGDWQLEQVTLQDKASNLATYRTDNPIVAGVKINIAGDSCDSEAPRLIGVVVDPPDVVAARGPATITVTVTATDDFCGVEGVSGQYAGPVQGSGGFFPLQKAAGDTWTGRITLDEHAARGLWRITSMQLTDKAHNLRIIYVTDPLIANATFQVR